MKKSNKTLRVMALTLLVTIIALILLAQTYAKYTTTVSGQSTGIVASFSVGGVTEDSFALFNTVNEEDGTTIENEVASNRIAPGTGGYFEIELTNDSEVKVEYSLNIKETSNTSSIPIVYSTSKDGTYTTAADFTASDYLEIGSSTQTSATVTVYWKWAYEGNVDSADTTLGVASAEATTEDDKPQVTVTASVTFTQVD